MKDLIEYYLWINFNFSMWIKKKIDHTKEMEIKCILNYSHLTVCSKNKLTIERTFLIKMIGFLFALKFHLLYDFRVEYSNIYQYKKITPLIISI